MNPDDGRTPKYKRYPTYTSPQETASLIPRYGEHISPEPPPIPPPPIPPEPPVNPNAEELKELRAERKVLQGVRKTATEEIDTLRYQRSSINASLPGKVEKRAEANQRIKEINARIEDLV
jgi:chromatin segregation and condensation protein Rec8/ScpA/Scc1 (kleisin family)